MRRASKPVVISIRSKEANGGDMGVELGSDGEIKGICLQHH